MILKNYLYFLKYFLNIYFFKKRKIGEGGFRFVYKAKLL